jgi:hypothetical protein
MIWFRSLTVARDVSILQNAQTRSVAHSFFYAVGIESLSPGIKLPGHEADHLAPSIDEVRNKWD